jgi:enoyl-CoA hydratase
MIETTYEYGVAMVTMRHGKVNALDTMLCQALCGELDHAVADGAQAVVLTGTGTVFPPGWICTG